MKTALIHYQRCCWQRNVPSLLGATTAKCCYGWPQKWKRHECSYPHDNSLTLFFFWRFDSASTLIFFFAVDRTTNRVQPPPPPPPPPPYEISFVCPRRVKLRWPLSVWGPTGGHSKEFLDSKRVKFSKEILELNTHSHCQHVGQHVIFFLQLKRRPMPRAGHPSTTHHEQPNKLKPKRTQLKGRGRCYLETRGFIEMFKKILKRVSACDATWPTLTQPDG